MSSRYPSQEELSIIRESILLPMLLDVVQNQLRKLEHESMPLKKLFLQSTEMVMDAINADLIQVKRKLRESQIKVWEDDRPHQAALYYRYVCRGYEDSFAVMKEVAKSELSIMLGKYVEKVVREMKKAP